MNFFRMLRHLMEYTALVRWLGGKAIALFRYRLALSALLSIASVGVELAAFIVVFKMIQQYQSSGLDGLSNRLEELGFPAWVAAVSFLGPTLLLLIASGLHYLGRSMALSMQSALSVYLNNEILQRLSRSLTVLDYDNLPYGIDQSDIAQVVSSDTMMCGMAVRQVLLQITSAPYLVVGMGLLAVLAPLLLVLCLVAVGLLAPILYYLNLRAVIDSRDLSTTSPLYRRSLVERVRRALGKPADLDPAEADLTKQFSKAFDGRLQMVEALRFVLAFVFALAVGALLWGFQRSDLQSIFNSAHLLLVFLAFRYTYQGLQGVSVLVASVNRNVPSILKVYAIDRKLDLLEGRHRQLEIARSAPAVAREFKWLAPGLHARDIEGSLAIGNSICVLDSGPIRLGLLGQIGETIVGRNARMAFLAWAEKSILILRNTLDDDTQTEDEDAKAWIQQIFELGSERDLKWREDPGTLRFLLRVYQAGPRPAGLVVLDGNLLFMMSRRTRRVVLSHLSSHLVVVISDRAKGYLRERMTDVSFVSNGKRIVLAVTKDEQVEEADIERADALFRLSKPQSKLSGDRSGDRDSSDPELVDF